MLPLPGAPASCPGSFSDSGLNLSCLMMVVAKQRTCATYQEGLGAVVDQDGTQKGWIGLAPVTWQEPGMRLFNSLSIACIHLPANPLEAAMLARGAL